MPSQRRSKADREIARLEAENSRLKGLAAEVDEAREGAVFVRREFSGPLPDPEMLRAYDDTYPGSVKLILDEFSKEAEERRSFQRDYRMISIEEVRNQRVERSRGQWMSYSLAIFLCVVTALSVWLRAEWVALASIVAVIGQISLSLFSVHKDRGKTADSRESEVQKPGP